MADFRERLKTLQEKFIGKDDFAISMSGEPLKKRGTISFYREDWDMKNVPHELWTDSKKTVQLATNGVRPTDKWVCNNRYCAVHKERFKSAEYGYDLEVPGKGTIHGDLMRCHTGGEEYMEGLSSDALKKFNK